MLAWAGVAIAAVGVAAFCWWVMQDDRRARSAHRAELRVIARQQHQPDAAPGTGATTAGEGDEHEREQRAA